MKTTLRVALLTAALSLTIGDLAQAQPGPPAHAEVQITPALNQEAAVEVGSPLLTIITGIMSSTAGVKLRADASGKGAGPGTYLTIGSGPLRKEKETAKGVYWSSPTDKVQLTTVGVKQPGNPGGIFIPVDPNKPATLWWGGMFGMTEVSPSAPVDYERTVDTSFLRGETFRRELVFVGLSKGAINLLYREYRDGVARPAFSQEASYDLSPGDEIGFKGARIRVLKANNVELRYVVLKPLSD